METGRATGATSGEPVGNMAMTSSIDTQLLAEAHRIGGLRTKKATVTKALEEFIQRRKQAKIPELFGTVAFDPKYDYKKQRRKP
jgi:hypothetical protein